MSGRNAPKVAGVWAADQPAADRDAAAIVRTAWVAVRSEPTHRAEMTSQWLCGETLTVLARREGWIRGRGPDEYEGWTVASPLLTVDPPTAAAWSEGATARSLGARLDGAADSEPTLPTVLPWGARLRSMDDGWLELPDGRLARPIDPATILEPRDADTRFPCDGARVVETGRRWLGVPYLWGGRTEGGVDCSGYVQSVLAVHGVPLPRDSHQQPAVGSELPAEQLLRQGGFEPGDLVFFAPEGQGVTHVAICEGGGRILHAAASNGEVRRDDLGAGAPYSQALRNSLVTATRPLTG